MTANLPDPMLPTPFVVQKVKRETSDTYTLDLTRADGATNFAFAPGQFNMLYAFGAGEVPISISGDPAAPEPWCTPSGTWGTSPGPSAA